jgi:hypothetical protein
MFTKRVWLIIGALTILSAGVIGVGTYLLKKPTPVLDIPEGEKLEESIFMEPEEPTFTEPEEISPVSEVDTSDWKVYSTPVYSIKYPNTWNADKASPLEKITNIWIQPQNAKGNYPRLSINYFDLKEVGTTIELQRRSITRRKYISKEENTIIINSISAWKLSGELDGKTVDGVRQEGLVQNTVVILERNDEFFIFDFQYEGEKNIDLEKIFKTMISNFRFL